MNDQVTGQEIDDRQLIKQWNETACRRELLWLIVGVLVTHSIAFVLGYFMAKILCG